MIVRKRISPDLQPLPVDLADCSVLYLAVLLHWGHEPHDFGNSHKAGLQLFQLHLADFIVWCVAQLFIGDTNRMIAETPMNLASSRSHCIFAIQIEARKVSNKNDDMCVGE
jgi:hypothetical protein